MSYSRKLFTIATEIINKPTLGIAATVIDDLYQEHSTALLESGALVAAPPLRDIFIREDGEFVPRSVEYFEGRYRRFTKRGWVYVEEHQLKMYNIFLEWVLKNVLYGLGLDANHKYITILDQFIWYLGNVKIRNASLHIIVVRYLRSDEVYKVLEQYLYSYHTKIPALVIALDSRLSIHLRLPSSNILMKMPEVLLHDESDDLSFNISLILEKMGKKVRKEGFSEGYRSSYFNGVAYTFSKIQAEVIELLDKTGKRMHQDEIMSRITTNSSNTRLVSLFQSRGKMHLAWGVILKHDSKGFYWIYR